VKLTHRDFRPLRRSKYVAQPLKRRPTLRILLLAALGVIIYLKYDTVVRSKAFKSLSEPAKLWHAMLNGEGTAAPAIASGTGLRWSPDSAFLAAECSGSVAAACLESWSKLGREPVGTLRAVLVKARIQWSADAGNGFRAKFARLVGDDESRDGKSGNLELVQVELRGGTGSVILEQSEGERTGLFCEGEKCLDQRPTQLPFGRVRAEPQSKQPGSEDSATGGAQSIEPQSIRLFSLEGSAVKPILPGRVVAVPDSAASNPWMKIYHGENIFSWYRGFSSLRSGIAPGVMIGSGDTLGFVAARGDTAEALDLRIEKDGTPADPFAFLGIVRAEHGL
jgi:hypothetical protein